MMTTKTMKTITMTTKTAPLPLNSTIGILGGGQLGRMLAMAAAKLGMKTHIFCPDSNSPAFEVSHAHTIADYNDLPALENFANSVDIITYEFENVPVDTAQYITQFSTLAPDANILSISQDRLLEKQFLQSLNIDICAYEPVSSRIELDEALKIIGTPAVLKTTRLGYDGKGQRIIMHPQEADKAYEDLAGSELILEAFSSFDKEISVIIARNEDGHTAAFDPAENIHKNHILHTSTVPASLSPMILKQAILIAEKIANALNYQGILAVEFFVMHEGSTPALLVNEIAPRVHNSGHWTLNGCPTDQFEQHIRAICNWPLGATLRHNDVTMTNLIGDEIHQIPTILHQGDIPHIYGKGESRPGRKMGHINSVFAYTKK